MRFGFHITISGGFSKAAVIAGELGCRAIQIFSCNPRSWVAAPIDSKDAQDLKIFLKEQDIDPLCVHLSYLPNISSPDPALYAKSVEKLKEEILRASLLGARFLIVHIGRTMGSTLDEGSKRVTGAINEILPFTPSGMRILLENTAGQGSEIGYKFDQIGTILQGIDKIDNVGVCFDTAHAFQSGYDISSINGVDSVLEDFDKHIGLNRIGVIHLNDSRSPLGSHVDRHWHIGEGRIGIEGMRTIICHKALRHLPAIMETPKKQPVDDIKNMKIVKKLSGC